MSEMTRPSVLVIACGLGLAAHAQEAPPSSGVELEEVVVTAQHRQERLQDVPISITAVSADSLEQRGVLNVSDLQGVIPGLTISGFMGVTVSNLISLRGVSGQPIPIGASLPTAVYLDGVYLSRPDAAFFSLDDVERIEVLRGPQGTLYGRNATAGAINVITRTPGEAFEGGLNASVGNFGAHSLRGSVTGPISSRWSFGISGAYDTYDGYYRNTVTGNRVGDRESETLRGKLRYLSAGGRFDAMLSADYSRIDAHEFYRVLVGPASAGSPYLGVGTADRVTSDSENRHEQPYESQGAGLVMNFEVTENFNLTSVTSAREFESFVAYDFDGTAQPTFFATSGNESETYSQEVRGVYDAGRFRLTAGVNYYHEEASFFLGVNPPPGSILRNPLDTTEVDAMAVFSQLEFDITDSVTLIGGLRYNDEERDFTISYVAPAVPLKTGSVSDGVVLPSFGVNFQPRDALLLYAKVSEGYQPPGFSYLPGPFSTPPFTFKREQLTAYEVGLKTQWLDRRLTLNGAVFSYDYEDMQIRTVRGATDTKVENAAAATVEGVEAELTLQATDRLSIGAQVTYSKATYDEFCEPISAGSPRFNDPLCVGGEADRSGNYLNYAPEWSGGINVAHSVVLGDALTLNWNASYSFETKTFFTAPNELAASNPDGWDRIDARVGFEFANGLEIYGYGRNITDERYVVSGVRAGPSLVFGAISEPRTYGLGARIRF